MMRKNVLRRESKVSSRGSVTVMKIEKRNILKLTSPTSHGESPNKRFQSVKYELKWNNPECYDLPVITRMFRNSPTNPNVVFSSESLPIQLILLFAYISIGVGDIATFFRVLIFPFECLFYFLL